MHAVRARPACRLLLSAPSAALVGSRIPPIEKGAGMMHDLDTPFTVSPEQIAQYHDDGFIRLAAVLDPDTLKHFGAEITRLTLDLNMQDKPLEARNTYDRAFLQVMNLWQSSVTAKRFVFGQRLARIAANLMGVGGFAPLS
jgi:hypothetical protein